MKELEQVKAWPKNWSYDRASEAFGERLLVELTPFVELLEAHGYTKRTIDRHLGYLFLLGGEIVSQLAVDEEYDRDAREVLLENIDEEGGPLCRHLHTDTELNQYDATCRKLHKFMEKAG
jgi:hypothetical protein